jgi:hypothetical protein
MSAKVKDIINTWLKEGKTGSINIEPVGADIRVTITETCAPSDLNSISVNNHIQINVFKGGIGNVNIRHIYDIKND